MSRKVGPVTCPHCHEGLKYHGQPDLNAFALEGKPLRMRCPGCGRHYAANVHLGPGPEDFVGSLVEVKP